MQPARRGLGIGMMLLPMVGHFVWNGSGALLGGPTLAVNMAFSVVLSIVILFIFIAFYRMTLAPERQTVRDVLQPEVEAG